MAVSCRRVGGGSTRQFSVKPLKAGAVPVRKDGKLLLVRSSDGLRWVFPKGHLTKSTGCRATAVKETWEEAGVIGIPSGPSYKVGHTVYYKFRILRVENSYPEKKTRKRVWVTPEEARRIMDPKFIPVIETIIQELR